MGEVAQSCPTLCDPIDCSLPDPSVHGIFQARVLWLPDTKADSLEKTLILGKIEGEGEGGWQRMKQWDGITDSMDRSLNKPG